MDVKELLVKGLCSTPKYIDMSCRYDKQGSIYDDQCQDIEDFYHYKAEEAIMRCNAKDAALQLKTPLRLFDLGCGSTTKSQYLINELLANKIFFSMLVKPLKIYMEIALKLILLLVIS